LVASTPSRSCRHAVLPACQCLLLDMARSHQQSWRTLKTAVEDTDDRRETESAVICAAPEASALRRSCSIAICVTASSLGALASVAVVWSLEPLPSVVNATLPRPSAVANGETSPLLTSEPPSMPLTMLPLPSAVYPSVISSPGQHSPPSPPLPSLPHVPPPSPHPPEPSPAPLRPPHPPEPSPPPPSPPPPSSPAPSPPPPSTPPPPSPSPPPPSPSPPSVSVAVASVAQTSSAAATSTVPVAVPACAAP
jgi:hypothetical protein